MLALCAGALGACGLGAGSAFAAPVGMACRVTGKPEVKSGGAWKPLKLLQRVEAGDAVRCSAGEEATIVLFGNGNRYLVAAGKQATVEADSLAGAKVLAGAGGPSASAARALGGARVGAVMARPASSHQRLMPQSTGSIVVGADGLLRVAWMPAPDATSYSFNLLDRYDDVVWHERVADKTETIIGGSPPAAIEKAMGGARLTWQKDGVPQGSLQLGKPYVWQIVAFGKSGKMAAPPRWGVVTFLGQAEADELAQSAAPLLDEARRNPTDPTPHAMLAELYRTYGVYDRTLEELEALEALNAEGALDALHDAYDQISPYALGRWLLKKDGKPAEPAAQ